MTRPPLEAVVFDAGGTLVRLDFEWMASALAEFGVTTSASRLRRGEVEGRRRYDASRRRPEERTPLGGPGDVREYLGGTLLAAGVPAEVIGAAVTRFLEHEKSDGLWTRPVEGAREAIDRVFALGLRRAVVSNSDGRAEWHLRHCGVLDGIEFVVDSHHAGIEKPDPRVFAIALERLGVAADRALYVGDIRSVDEAGALGAGMRFVLIDPHGDYAGPETPAIAGMRDLPDWITGHFTVPGRAAAAPRVSDRDDRRQPHQGG